MYNYGDCDFLIQINIINKEYQQFNVKELNEKENEETLLDNSYLLGIYLQGNCEKMSE